ncbi:MAG: ImmA/IrrE family metallo-endopeptidase [candidate division Zixibacteria bacterium]|nr:ImmA/IrrE family metallo-endopeptidase [candidate division Zixibacteria bacterium]
MSRLYYPSNKVDFYSGRVLEELGLSQPPIPVEPILEYFGLPLYRTDDPTFDPLPEHLREISKAATAGLCIGDDFAFIWVNGEDSEGRQRLGVFHECGHFDIPWHRGHSYVCNMESTAKELMSKLEQEAFRYASKMIFPTAAFREDLMSAPIGVPSISGLADRYQASFEATAIRYIESNPGMCAGMYLRPNPATESTDSPYVVKYSIKSKRFHHYWKPGEAISYHDQIESCFLSNRSITCEIPASVFGSQKKHSYLVEMRPYGPEQMFVLLNIPERQISIL